MNVAAAVAHNSVGDTSNSKMALKKRSNDAIVLAVNIPPHEPGHGVACSSMSARRHLKISPKSPQTYHKIGIYCQ